jgi:hypothetical protein
VFRRRLRPSVRIDVDYNARSIVVRDNAAGIDFDSALHEVFRFGHSADYAQSKDRLSVFGIGMKRAIFKMGNKISMVSDHRGGGFELELNVKKWAKEKSVPWTMPITKRKPNPSATGTTITISELHEEVQRRLADSRFHSELVDKFGKVYSYFLGRIVEVYVNKKKVDGTTFEIGKNFSHDKFRANGVACSVTAGIASAAAGDKYPADTAGWFVFCNFRTVIYGDKTPLTGWGATLPLFQPKHRPFLGIASFTSADLEALPWTTTKGSINEDSLVWQEAKLRMVAVARPVLRLLDERYSSAGTEIDPTQMAKLSGAPENVFKAVASRE